jgi:hypothetical protein
MLMNAQKRLAVAMVYFLWIESAVAFTSLSPAKKCITSPLYAADSTTVTTLTDATTWDFRFSLKGLPTKNGKRVDEIFAARVQFIEEVGYEPPQGCVEQIITKEDTDGDGEEDEESDVRFKISKSRWQLSEDPTDRKDGLWVWGLFQEPLYPFLLLQLETDIIPLAGEDEDSILPLKLFAQLTHQREKEVGVILSSGNDLKVRVMETMKADPFGAATVEIYEEVSVGNLQVQPMQTS